MFPRRSRPFIASSERLVRIFVTASIPEGHLARGLLESEGIPVFVKGESEGPYRMGPMYLYVPEDFEINARLVLAEVKAQAQRAALDEERMNEDGWDDDAGATAWSTEEPSGPS